MRTVYKMLVGLTTAIVVMIIASLIILTLGIDLNDALFFVGWVSCMGLYTSMSIFDKSKPQE